MRNSPEYKAWSEAKQRCHNPKSSKYKWYGARGIAVCEEWKNDFMSFYSHIGTRPDGYELDRIDNSKGYEPNNVRWVCRKENVRNRRNSIYVIYEGVRLALEDYAKKIGVEYQTAWARLKKYPHMIESLKTKKGGENNTQAKLTFLAADEIRVSNLTAKELAQKYGVSKSTIYGIKNGNTWRTMESSPRYEAKTL